MDYTDEERAGFFAALERLEPAGRAPVLDVLREDVRASHASDEEREFALVMAVLTGGLCLLFETYDEAELAEVFNLYLEEAGTTYRLVRAC